MRKIHIILASFFLFVSCSGIELVLEDGSRSNPLFENTSFVVNGDNKELFSSYMPDFFESTKYPDFHLIVDINEKKTKKLIEKNQVASKTDHEIYVNYTLKHINKMCVLTRQEIFSRFSFIPKAEGYNFGSDKSLDNLYKSSFKKNIKKFINNVPPNTNTMGCVNEN